MQSQDTTNHRAVRNNESVARYKPLYYDTINHRINAEDATPVA